MRVLHLGKFLPPHAGGIERFLAELMPAQRALGVQPAALIHAEPGFDGRHCRLQARAATLRAPVLATIAHTPISPGWACRLDALIKRWTPDVLHLHLPNPSAFWALGLPSARRLPWVVHWHSDVPADALDLRLRLLYRVYRPLESAVLRRAACILATTDAYAASSAPLARWRDKIAVVPLGLPDQAAAKPDESHWPTDARLRLLFVGRFSYYKGLHVLIEAMRRLPADCALLLVGDGDQRDAIERQVAAASLTHRVRFAGRLEDGQLAAAYAAADVLCLPSIERSEAFGVVLLEAMRAARPAIATRVAGSGMADVLGDGTAGLLVPPGDTDAVAAAILRLRQEPELRDRLGANGRQRFVDRYRIERVAERIDEQYRLLVG